MPVVAPPATPAPSLASPPVPVSAPPPTLDLSGVRDLSVFSGPARTVSNDADDDTDDLAELLRQAFALQEGAS